MTRAEFDATYELLAEQGLRSYTARTRRTRSVVMVHFFDPEPSPATNSILARLQTLSPEDRSFILQTIDVDGAPVVITKYIRNLTTLGAWVATRTGEATIPDLPSLPAESFPSVDRGPATKPGEFTQLFGKAEQPPSQAKSSGQPAMPGRDDAGAGTPAEPTSKSKPGEFTQLFGKAEQPPPLAKSPGPLAVPGNKDAGTGLPGTPTSKNKPGEFTQLFEKAEKAPSLEKSPEPVPPRPVAPPKPSPSPPPPPPPAAAKGPGEFTRLFSPENPSEPTPWTNPPAEAPKGPWGGAKKPPGELTRLFGEQADASRPPVPPSYPARSAPDAGGDDFSRRLAEGSGSPPPVERPPVERVPDPMPKDPRAVARPGEFTEMFGNTGDRPDANTAPRVFGTDPAPAPSMQVPTPSPPPPPPAASPAGLPGGGAGDYLQRLRGGNPEVSPRPVVPNPPPRGSPGPSAFTRALRRVSSKVKAPVPSPTVDPDPGLSTGTPGLGIVLGVIGVVGVIAVGLLLYFLLTRT